MRIAFLHPQGGGVAHYRADVPCAAMRERGVDATYVHASALRDVHDVLVKASEDCDLIHAGYFLDPDAVALLAAARQRGNIPVITDIDDDPLKVPAYNIAYGDYHAGTYGRKVARMQLRISDAVSVSTGPLSQALSAYARETTVLPNCIAPAYWEGLPTDPLRDEDKSVRFMFAGNLGRYGDLAEVRTAFEWAMDKFPQLRLIFMGCVPDWALPWMADASDANANRAFSVRHCGMSTYPAILHWVAPDVFFSPVVQSEFNASKSHIKAYDAAMIGAAFLCTDWATYADVPADAAVKVAGEYEWKEAITALVEDVALRKRLSTRLKDWALGSWTIDVHIDKWVDLYTRTVERGPARSLDDLVRPGEDNDVSVGSGRSGGEGTEAVRD